MIAVEQISGLKQSLKGSNFCKTSKYLNTSPLPSYFLLFSIRLIRTLPKYFCETPKSQWAICVLHWEQGNADPALYSELFGAGAWMGLPHAKPLETLLLILVRNSNGVQKNSWVNGSSEFAPDELDKPTKKISASAAVFYRISLILCSQWMGYVSLRVSPSTLAKIVVHL